MDNGQNYNDRKEEVMEMQMEHDSLPKLSITFVGVAREKRERSAAKFDDAAVPKYLWLEHLFNNAVWNWNSEKKEQILNLVDWLRMHMLRRWKRNVFRSFIRTFYQSNPKLNSSATTVEPILGSVGTFSWTTEGFWEAGLFIGIGGCAAGAQLVSS
jgi:hypothetical protein